MKLNVSRLFRVCAVSGILAGLASNAAAATFLYVSQAPEARVQVLKVDDEPGQLTPVSETDVGGAPGSLGTDPNRKFLFASIRSKTAIASFRIDGTTGRLSPIHTVPLAAGANAAYVTTDRTGRFLIAASYSGAQVTVHRIGDDGRLSDAALQTVATAKTAHAVAVTADNRFVFVPHVSPNAVFQFRLDADSGQLTEFGRAAGGAEKAGPRHIALHPSGRFAFTSDETGSSITAYSLAPDTGLKPLQTLSTLPAEFRERNSTAEVKLHPSGKFVWVSNRGHDSLAGFRFDETSGQLSPLGQTPTEKTPRSFDIVPSGRFLYSAGEGNGKLAGYRIDPESGQLTRVLTLELGKSLTWVQAVRP